MPVVLEDRPTASVREEVIDQLIMNYSHGKLSRAAFERRLDDAMNSEDNVEIAKLSEDLELIVDEKYENSKQRDFGVSYSPQPGKEHDKLVNVFGCNNRSGRWTVAKELQSFSLFGTSTLDFSEAEFTHPDVTYKVLCLFGGDTLYVPENVKVVSNVFCIFGSVDNAAPSIPAANSPTITIEGHVIFGSIDIKLKQTIKEKFVAFADNLKSMFG